jgi:O-antigen ligase
MRNIERALQLVLIASIPFQGYLPLIKRGGRPTLLFTVSDIAFFLLLFYWLLTRQNSKGNMGRLKWPQFIYVLLVVPSVFVANDLSASAIGLFTLIKYYVFFCYICEVAQEKKTASFLLKCLLVLNVVVVVVSLLNKFVLPVGAIYGLEEFGKRNSLGPLLAELPFALLGVLVLKKTPGVRLGGLFLFMLSVFALVANQSRSAWAGFLGGSIFFLTMGLRLRSVKKSEAGLIVFLLAIVLVASMPYLKERLGSGFKDDAAQDRIYLNRLAFEVIKDNPALGVGLRNYEYEMKKYVLMSKLDIPWVAGVHNQYLLVWAETGTLAFVAFAVMLLMTVIRGVRISKSYGGYSPLVLGFVSILVSFMIQMLFDSFGESWMIWGSMAIISELFREAKLRGVVGCERRENSKFGLENCGAGTFLGS